MKLLLKIKSLYCKLKGHNYLPCQTKEWGRVVHLKVKCCSRCEKITQTL